MTTQEIVSAIPQKEKDRMLTHLIEMAFVGESGKIQKGIFHPMEQMKVLPEVFAWQFKQYTMNLVEKLLLTQND